MKLSCVSVVIGLLVVVLDGGAATTNVPSLRLEYPNGLVVSNAYGWDYAVERSSDMSNWTSYVQSHYGRGVNEKWYVNDEMTDGPYFCRVVASNYSAGASGATGSVSILHYPEPEATGRVWTIALYMVNTAGTITNHPVTPQLEWYTPQQLGDLYFKDVMGANAFLKDISGGKASLAGTVIGWIEEPEQDLASGDISSDASYYFGLGDPYIRYTDYDVHVMHARVKGSGQQTGWLYPHQSFNTPQGNISGVGINWMINSAVFDFAPFEYSNWSSDDSILPTVPWIHEFLHTIGINGHANSYDCGTNTISQVTTTSPIKAYGNPFCVMGERAYATHPGATMKLDLGWISSNQIDSVISNGVYSIHPLELSDGQVKALSVPLSTPITNNNHGFAFDHLVIEYRRPIGFDKYLGRLDGSTFLSRYKPEGTVTNNGVLVYMEYPEEVDTDATLLLDMHPTSSFDPTRGIKWSGNAGKFADAMLNIGETFTWGSVSMTPLGTNAAGAMQMDISL